MLFVLSTLLTSTLSLAPPDAPPRARARLTAERIDVMLTAPDRRVRALDPALASLVADGVRRSCTFGRLLESVEATDVIVYIEADPQMPLSLAGRLMLVPGHYRQRYLRIQVAPHGADEDMIATIAHELRHAVEVAESPEVRDEPGLIALYKRIGHNAGGRHAFDTSAARDAGRIVRSELG